MRRERPETPAVDEDVSPGDLDREVRSRLRGLSRPNAEQVAKHLVMAGRYLDSDPELAHAHAQAAVQRAARVDVVREAAGITAYRTGRWAEALRELRTHRRLTGSNEHLPLMADCERGLGRPERAIRLAASPEAAQLDEAGRIELALVVSGARLDLGDPEAALVALADLRPRDRRLAARVAIARTTALEALGRAEEAERELSAFAPHELEAASGVPDEVEVLDLEDLAEEEGQGGTEQPAPDGKEEQE